ncbi:hypothetical protein ANN_25636 [Periplaneta americana]|uniref:Uncharacterized protein n=1 Tax=Periplaneta americana TaxID=6978 RepID=A0ABQ8S3Z0_PERAM|nr:hypothetical protein ANN_25636 [Periplaneta americana]
MAGLCEGGNEPPGSLKASRSSAESYPAFALIIELRENPDKNLNQPDFKDLLRSETDCKEAFSSHMGYQP